MHRTKSIFVKGFRCVVMLVFGRCWGKKQLPPWLSSTLLLLCLPLSRTRRREQDDDDELSLLLESDREYWNTAPTRGCWICCSSRLSWPAEVRVRSSCSWWADVPREWELTWLFPIKLFALLVLMLPEDEEHEVGSSPASSKEDRISTTSSSTCSTTSSYDSGFETNKNTNTVRGRIILLNPTPIVLSSNHQHFFVANTVVILTDFHCCCGSSVGAEDDASISNSWSVVDSTSSCCWPTTRTCSLFLESVKFEFSAVLIFLFGAMVRISCCWIAMMKELESLMIYSKNNNVRKRRRICRWSWLKWRRIYHERPTSPLFSFFACCLR